MKQMRPEEVQDSPGGAKADRIRHPTSSDILCSVYPIYLAMRCVDHVQWSMQRQ